jgi:Domain of unknown function (DUF4838)
MKKIITKILICVFFALSTLLLQAEIPLTKDGKALAEIVIDAKADKVMKYAASELQHWIKEISGAKLPIVRKPGGMEYKIFLKVNPPAFEADLVKLQGNDGYAVHEKGKELYLIASKSKGILNGVFKLLFKNTDIIWARPNVDFGTIFSKNSNLILTQTDYIDIPVFIVRGWQMIGPRLTSEFWQARNGSNWSAATLNYNPKLAKFGNVLEYGGGHNLVKCYITGKKYFKKHPDFFPLIDEERVGPTPKHKVQLCFMNPAMTTAFIREVDAKIRKNPDYDTYRIMIEDNYKLCNCPKCVKPIKLADGKIIYKRDKAFRSTQFFLFLNQIARHMRKNYPGKKILTFGYFFTEIPPYCKVEPNISISFCPIYKNSKATMQSYRNTKTRKKFMGWLKNTRNLTLREYFGLCGPYPRPVDAIAIADWRYVNKLGINKTYSEMYSDAVGRRMDGVKTWDLNSMYFWTLANACWNPYQDVKTLRKEFLKRVYGKAADDVGEFYSVLEKSWHKVDDISRWNDKAGFVWRRSVEEQNLAGKCRKLLESAAAKVLNVKSRKMLNALRAAFEEQVRIGKAFSTTAKKVDKKPVFAPDFNLKEWKKAPAAAKFVISNNTFSREKTSIKILYDKTNIYFGIKCFDKKPGQAYARPAGQPRDKWPAGDKIELFVTGYDKLGKVSCNQIVLDINGNIYDSQNKNINWNADFALKCKVTANGWSAMLTLPFKEINVDLNKNPQIKVMFVRYWNHKSDKMEVSFWEQGVVHNYHSFGDLIFD